MGSALRVVTDWIGDPSRVRSYFVRFTKPVVVPDDAEGTELVFGGVVEAVDDGAHEQRDGVDRHRDDDIDRREDLRREDQRHEHEERQRRDRVEQP